MPRGRLITKTIAYCEQLSRVSLKADYLFMRIIPHLDSEGRMKANPAIVWAQTCPLRKDLSLEDVELCLAELEESGLIVRFHNGEVDYLCYPKFFVHQSIKNEAEPHTSDPAAPDSEIFPGSVATWEQLRSNYEVGAQQVRSQKPARATGAQPNRTESNPTERKGKKGGQSVRQSASTGAQRSSRAGGDLERLKVNLEHPR